MHRSSNHHIQLYISDLVQIFLQHPTIVDQNSIDGDILHLNLGEIKRVFSSPNHSLTLFDVRTEQKVVSII